MRDALGDNADRRVGDDSDRVENETDGWRFGFRLRDRAIEHAREHDGCVAEKGCDDILHFLVEALDRALNTDRKIIVVDQGLVMLVGDKRAIADHLLKPVVSVGRRHIRKTEILCEDEKKLGEGFR